MVQTAKRTARSVPESIEIAIRRLEWGTSFLARTPQNDYTLEIANEKMASVRRCEGMVGNFLGETDATYEDVAAHIERLRVVRGTLVAHGAAPHADHCDADDRLSHYGLCVTQGARKRLVHHPVWGRWKTTPLGAFVEIDPDLTTPSSVESDLDPSLEATVIRLTQVLDDHVRGRRPLSTDDADELVSFFERAAQVLDLLQRTTQEMHTKKIKTLIENFTHSGDATRPAVGAPGAPTVREFSTLCQSVLTELDEATAAARSAITESSVSDDALAYGRSSDITDARSPGRLLDATRAQVRASHAAFADEPFMLRIEATTAVDGGEPACHQRTYAVSRHAVAGIKLSGLTLVSARSRVGLHLRSTEPDGHLHQVPNTSTSLAVNRRVEVAPTGSAHAQRDAAVILDANLQTPSAREWLARVAASESDDAAPLTPTRRPASDRRRSFQLFDQGSLYKAQRQVLESVFDEPLALIGPPGTGKTTAVVKRVVDVLALATDVDEGLAERRIELGIERAVDSGCSIESWVMLVPHADWVRYARKAFHAEGRVRIDPELVRTWDSLRAVLHRRAFGGGLEPAGPEEPAAVEDALLQSVISRFDGTLSTALADAHASLALASSRLELGTPRPLATDASIATQYAAVTHLLELLHQMDPGRQARTALSSLIARLAPTSSGRRSLTGSVRALCIALARDETLDDDLDGLRERLYLAGASFDDLETAGAWSLASTSLTTLQRAQLRWLEVDALLAELAAGLELPLSPGARRDLTFFLALRNARIAYMQSAGAGKPKRNLPELSRTALGLMFGHLYVDEFENRSTLELATLACLTHPSSGAVVFSGDPHQATENSSAPADLRLQLALSLASMPQPRVIAFDRRVRQSSLLSAVSDALRGGALNHATIDAGDPALVLTPSLDPAQWTAWTATHLRSILSSFDQPVTTAVIAPSAHSRAQLALTLGLLELPFGVQVFELDEERRPASAEPAIYVASLEDPHLLHGLEFEGVLLLGVDDMLALPHGNNRVYVAMTRAARYLGMASTGPWPSALVPLRDLAKGTPW